MKQHKGKIVSLAGGAAVITAIALLTPSGNPDLSDEAARDSALTHAVELAARFEGLRLDAYHDQAGYPTIGYGHKLSDEQWGDLTHITSITEAVAESLLAVDMQVAFDCLDRYVEVELDWNELAALADFTFNEGCGHLERSTLLRALNMGHKNAVPHELLRWRYAGGHVEPGLLERREAEVELWKR